MGPTRPCRSRHGRVCATIVEPLVAREERVTRTSGKVVTGVARAPRKGVVLGGRCHGGGGGRLLPGGTRRGRTPSSSGCRCCCHGTLALLIVVCVACDVDCVSVGLEQWTHNYMYVQVSVRFEIGVVGLWVDAPPRRRPPAPHAHIEFCA